MEKLISIYNWFQANLGNITEVVAYVIAASSIVVKLTPTLKDDNVLKGIIKFVGKYLALDKYGPNGQA